MPVLSPLAARCGIARMLTVGLVIQITGFTLLSLLNPGWTMALSVAWVVLAQGVCGEAKDLTKTASKSAIKVTQAQAKDPGTGQLFTWGAVRISQQVVRKEPDRALDSEKSEKRKIDAGRAVEVPFLTSF